MGNATALVGWVTLMLLVTGVPKSFRVIYGDTLAICVFYSFVEKVIGKDRVGELCHTQNGCVTRENLAQYVKF